MKTLTAAGERATPGVAGQIRKARQRRRLSQQGLAAASGLSRNTISLLERGLTSPTVVTLQRIADALQVDLTTLLQEPGTAQNMADETPVEAVQSMPGPPPDQGSYSVDGLISALILRLEPNARCGSLLPHSGQTLIYCLEGRFLFSAGSQRHALAPGDSCLLQGRQPHYCQNSGNETAKALVIFLDAIL